jgi:glycosyltransferase involved in cell wall biosynthesis
MPCRDAAPHLREAIASLEAQTFRDFEVIAVDDGSSDDTHAILAAWSARDARVRVFREQGRGIVRSLVTAHAAARAALIGRMDADDVAHPDRFARQTDLLDRRSDVVACGTGVRYIPDSLVRDGARRYAGWLNGCEEPDDIDRDIFVECPNAHPALVVRREAFEAVGGYRDDGWPEDYDLVLRLWRAGGRLANVPAILLDWREGEHRLSRTDPRYDADAFRRCKVEHLSATLLRGRDGVVVWGAGPTGKAFARALIARGERLRVFIDIDPRKIGQTVYDVPVEPPDALHRYAGAFAVAAVGSVQGRTEIRRALDAAGWVESRDYCAVA